MANRRLCGTKLKTRTRSFTIRDEQYEALRELADASGQSVSKTISDLVPGESLRAVLKWCRSNEILGVQNYGEIVESLIAIGMLESEWLSKLSNLCLRSIVQDSENEPVPIRNISLQELLLGLKSQSQSERFRNGLMLAKSCGTALRLSGESTLDAEFGVGKDLSQLIGKSMAGDVEAVDHLESILTNKMPTAKPTATRVEREGVPE